MSRTHVLTAAVALAGAAAVPAGSTPARPPVPVAARAAVAPAPAPARVAAEPVRAVARHDHATHRHAAGGSTPARAGGSRSAATAARAATPKARAVPAAPGAPRWDGRAFGTPEAAMRFLVRAYNAKADRRLAHVTTPDARANLVAMRDYAPALRLTSCTRLESGAYDCEFTHSVAKTGAWDGYASFRVAPATRPGWYMTVLMECGDGEETA